MDHAMAIWAPFRASEIFEWECNLGDLQRCRSFDVLEVCTLPPSQPQNIADDSFYLCRTLVLRNRGDSTIP